ncbi:hypothetical protein VTN77DRAFT_2473 [Rasamsonia byssochlamydoides]|uniref:uncharacterized protein n=1 Tax=Rasamsonia byssochlamydoides TaxID=89139 RepID=UPI003742A0DF
MCVVEKVTDVYPDHVRTRRTIYRCSLSNGNDLCSNTRIHDLGERFHGHARQYDHSRLSPGIEVSASVEVESRPSSRHRSSRNIRRLTYKDVLHLFSLPFTRRSSRGARNRHMQDEMVSENTRDSYPTSREPQSSHGFSEIHSNQPPVASSSPPQEIFPSQSNERESSLPPPITRRPRHPRERSPVVERAPLRRPQTAPSSPPVVIQNRRPGQGPIEATGDQGSQAAPARRRVRFAASTEDDEEPRDVLYHDAGNNASSERRQRQSAQEEVQRARQRAQDSRERRHVEEETERSRRFIERNSSSRPSVRQINRQENVHTRRTEPVPAWRQTPPRVIQDGNRQLRDQGRRVIEDASARHSRRHSSEDHFRNRSGQGFYRISLGR